MEPQHQQLVDEEAKLGQTLKTLQARVNQFRTQKETLKAQYTAAKAMTSVNEGVAGISKSISDSGAGADQGPGQDRRHAGPLRAPWTSCSSQACWRTSAAVTTTSSTSSTRSGASSSVDQELAALKAGMGPAGAIEAGQPRAVGAAAADTRSSRTATTGGRTAGCVEP